MSRSWELLDGIVHVPQMTRAVKKMVIYAFASGNMTFERRESVFAFWPGCASESSIVC